MPEKLRPKPLVGAIVALAFRQDEEKAADEWATWW
jgi:hypothetical protein